MGAFQISGHVEFFLCERFADFREMHPYIIHPLVIVKVTVMILTGSS